MKIKNTTFLGEEIDVSDHFHEMINTYFNVDYMSDFDTQTLSGLLHFKRIDRKGRLAFNAYSAPYEDAISWNFPAKYPESPTWPIHFSFTAANAVRLTTCYAIKPPQGASPMIEKLPEYRNVEVRKQENGVLLKTDEMQVEIIFNPFSVVFRDAQGKLLTKTLHSSDSMCLQNCNPTPFSYVRTNSDLKKYAAASFLTQPNEHFYGGGESFTPLDKRGQKLVLWAEDAHGSETSTMYKPVPFYMSSKGYGIFAHTGAPTTLDFGNTYHEAQTVFVGEDTLDLFFFCGKPKDILTAYTNITGHSPVPPLWSFGLWMSRITYNSEKQVYDVVDKLQKNRIPFDVVHMDTGWFEEDWCCDYQFSKTRFQDPRKMIQDLLQNGYHISLWQLPYFTPENALYKELIERGLVILNADGELPTEDAILDFTNPDAVEWYQDKLRKLLQMGVSAIKADFGESAPLHGVYRSGRSGFVEHNLYPLRYNKAVAEVTENTTGNRIIWARSAWAGSQRYPIHWGGDAENTNMGMLSSLRGGLSLGMCGFTFWSHDSGGFVKKSPEELYGRWNFMSIFSSHIRCHGAPPKEPWEYSENFLNLFRRQLEMRYRLLPYLYAQSIHSAGLGHPLLRSMFFECPEDPVCFSLEDQYFFGEDILVAPFFEENITSRNVYLPKGKWVGLENKKVYQGERWYEMPAGALDGVALVREGAVIPMVQLAPNTKNIDWSTLTYHWYTADQKHMTGTGMNIDTSETFDCTKSMDKKLKVIVENGVSFA